MSATELIHAAAGSPPYPHPHTGVCRLCGANGAGLPFADWVKPTFTNHDQLRPGAGRPVRGEAPLAKVAVTLLPRHIEWATALGGGNLSAGIRKALDIAAENELNT